MAKTVSESLEARSALRELISYDIVNAEDAYGIPQNEADIQWLLHKLPEGLEKDPLNGLGFSTLDRFVPASISALAKNVLIVVQGGDSAPTLEDGLYVISELYLKRLVRAMRSISSRYQRQARADKRLLAHNELLTNVDPEQFRQERKN